jgi:hypothetical protein
MRGMDLEFLGPLIEVVGCLIDAGLGVEGHALQNLVEADLAGGRRLMHNRSNRSSNLQPAGNTLGGSGHDILPLVHNYSMPERKRKSKHFFLLFILQ